MPDNTNTNLNDIQDSQIAFAETGGDLHGDVTAGNKQVFSGDHNLNVLGNLTIYLSTRPTEPEPLAAQMVSIGPNPYKGLAAFDEDDADRFFGRETVVHDVWQKFCGLHEASFSHSAPLRFLSILGPSGSGKSSVARAGLLPELAHHPLPGRQRARVAVLTPGAHPLRALAAILARIATNDPVPAAKTREFESELRLATHPPTPCLQGREGAGSDLVYDGLGRIADVLPKIELEPLIVLVDQFEEIYSLCQESETCQQFIHNLLYAAADPSGHVSVILTLRSDFLGQTQSHPHLNHAIAANNLIVPVMNDAELRQAIAKPAELAGHPLDAATVDLLIVQSAGREGALPLLQFALTRIWEGLAEGAAPAATLQKIGGVGGALAGEAQRLYDKLADTDKAIARRAFLALVQLGEGAQDTRRRIAVPEIVAHGEDPQHVEAVLRVFAQPGARLVTLSADPERGEAAEVTHEALFTHWEMFKEWLSGSREDIRFQRRLAEAADRWETQGRHAGLLWRPPDLELLQDFHKREGQNLTPVQIEFFEASVALQAQELAEKEEQGRKEQHQQRTGRQLRLALVGLCLLLLGLAVIGYQWLRANRAEKNARTAEQDARQQAQKADEARAEADAQKELVQAYRLSYESRSIFEEFPQRSLLVASETLRQQQFDFPLAEQTLRDELAAVGGIPLRGHEGAIWPVIVSPNGRWLITAGDDATARLYDLTAPDIAASVQVLRGHEGAISEAAVSPDGHWLITGSADKTVRVWDLTTTDIQGSVQVLRGHEKNIGAVIVSPDSHWLISGSNDTTIRVWDLTAADIQTSARLLRGHEELVGAATVSPDGRWLITGSWDTTVRIWDLQAVDMQASMRVLSGHTSQIYGTVVTPDNRWLLTGSADRSVRIWDLQAADIQASGVVLGEHEQGVRAVAISPDGHWLITGSDDATVHIWDLTAADIADSVQVLRGHEQTVWALRVSPDNRWLITGSWDQTARIWDLQAKDIQASMRILRGHEGSINAVTVTPDGDQLISGSNDGTARIWNLANGDLYTSPRVLPGSAAWISAIIVTPDRRRIIAGTGGWTSRIWDLTAPDIAASAQNLGTEAIHPLYGMAVTPNSRWLLTGVSEYKITLLWDLTASDMDTSGRELTGSVIVVDPPDGRYLITGSDDGVVRIYDVLAANIETPMREWHAHDGPIRAIVATRDGRWLITGGDDMTARIWDLHAADIPTSVRVLRGHTDAIYELAVSSDGRWLSTGRGESSARVWDLQAADIAASARVLEGHPGTIMTATMTPDGRYLITGSYDHTVRIWDLQAIDPSTSARVLNGHKGPIYALTVSPDGRWLLTGSYDQTARLWDLQAADPSASVQVLRGHTGTIYAVAMTPDGRSAITGSDDTTVRIWNVQPQDLIRRACETVGRNLTATEWVQYFPGKPYQSTCPDLIVSPGD